MVLTSDRSSSGVLNSRGVAIVRSISSLANCSILVWYKAKKKNMVKHNGGKKLVSISQSTLQPAVDGACYAD